MRDKPDYYSQLARKQGYPARSVYKLEEIQVKFQPIKKGALVLDIGAAPGSWSLYALKKLRANVVGLDTTETVLPGYGPPAYNLIQGDLFDGRVWDSIIGLGPYDSILSDAAPMTSGSRLVDSSKSGEIAWRVLALARSSLEAGGNMVIKILQGGEEQALLTNMRGAFKKARAFKPKACRRESTETYLIGLEYLKKVLDGKVFERHNSV